MKPKITILTLSLVLSWISLSAQTTSTTSNGLNTIKTSTDYATMEVYLPAEINAGDMISGTVRSKAKGSNERQNANAGEQLDNYKIVLDGNYWSTHEGPQQWQVPEQVNNGQITAQVLNSKVRKSLPS